jgi:hypothetical protein
MSNAYTYTIIRYVHDAAAGETLNIGVLLYCRTERWARAAVEHRYERLSTTFRNFDGVQYRRTLDRLETSLRLLRADWERRPLFESMPEDASALARLLLPDEGLSFVHGPLRAGIGGDLDTELAILFEHMVSNQYERHGDARRSDEDVWRVYEKPLPPRVTSVLGPKRFVTPALEFEFHHAFKNEAWHVVQPISLDYVRAESVRDRATRWLGTAVGLEGAPDLAKIYFLLGSPREEHAAAYEKAKHLLDRASVPHVIVEEERAAEFAEELTDYMRRHQVIQETD